MGGLEAGYNMGRGLARKLHLLIFMNVQLGDKIEGGIFCGLQQDGFGDA
jgi:hypothetical protein